VSQFACVLQVHSGTHVTYRKLKLLSEDPENYKDAPTEGIRRILDSETGKQSCRSDPVDTSLIESIRMGTTVRPLTVAHTCDTGMCCRVKACYTFVAPEALRPSSRAFGHVSGHICRSLQMLCKTTASFSELHTSWAASFSELFTVRCRWRQMLY
jgi:Hydantoinase/oxoprolinase N-terminal region